MNKEEFVKECGLRGYCDKESAKRFCKEHPKANYTEDDLISCYRSASRFSKDTKGLRPMYGINGKSTAFSNGVMGNDSYRQDNGI